MSESAAFVRSILAGDLDAAGPFADWLEERGDPRGVLLRRRWKRWLKERADAADRESRLGEELHRPWVQLIENLSRIPGVTATVGEIAASVSDAGKRLADESFVRYVRERFPEETA